MSYEPNDDPYYEVPSMIVQDVITIRGRGPVACVTLAAEVRHAGASLRRTRDGTTWPIRGVERFAKFVGRPTLGEGEMVSLLLPSDADVRRGDEVEIVPQNENSPTKP